MSNYWDSRFLEKIDGDIKTVFEVGARYGRETLRLSQVFPSATFYSFECNPNTVDICKSCLEDKSNINFFSVGLGETNQTLPFYSYIRNNDGASSFLKRIDANITQKMSGYIEIKKLIDIMKDHNIESIDLLCMDVQGYELNVLKGCEDYLNRIKYIIMEEPKPVINNNFLPKDTFSKYIDAPSPQEIKDFMTANGFVELVRIAENAIEDNVMYVNSSCL